MRRVLSVLVACAAALALLLPAALLAAEPGSRTVYVTVMDSQGGQVAGLVPEDFAVKESGKDCKVTSVAPASEKMRLALMVEQPLAAQSYVRTALREFVTRIYPSAEIALFMITQRPEKLVDYTSAPSLLIDGIDDLPLSQVRLSTAVPDAIYEVARDFEKTKPARPVIVLATLEQGQMSEVDPEGTLSQIAKSKAQFWSVSIQPAGSASGSSIRSVRDFAGRSQIIGDGPAQSGGRRIPVLTLPGFLDGLHEIANDLSNQYLITYALPDGVKTSDRIAVSLKKPGLTLRAPSRVPKK